MARDRENYKLYDLIEKKAATDSGFAIAFALLELVQEQKNMATQIKYLGNGDAATPMGAIEAFGVQFKESLNRLADAVESIRDGI